ncbi:hypothetical protein BDN67DRAFT_1006478 [Paxillus ammoniavirescens]|nr:hypothetical protein BDN67DRAFT_1006478 [Paxillus ammoniavirescens]
MTGSAITLRGIANCTFDVIVDGNYHYNLSTHGNGSLFSANLPQTNHSITLAPILSEGSRQQLAFQSSEISLDPPDGESLALESISSTNTTVFKYEGDWKTDNNTHVPGSVYHYTNTSGSTVSLMLSNVSIVVLRGVLDVGFGTFSVSLNGTEGIFNGSTNWFLPVVSLYYQSGLDPLETYSLEVRTTSPGGFGLQSVSLYSLDQTGGSSGQSGKSTNVGIIVGPVVAAVVLILAALGFFAWRRRRMGHLRLQQCDSGEDVPQRPNSAELEIVPYNLLSSQSSQNRPQTIKLTPVGGHRSSASWDTTGAVGSVTSGAASPSDRMTSNASSSQSANNPPLTSPTQNQQNHALEDQPHVLRQPELVQQTPVNLDSEVNRILQLIATRIDAPSDEISDAPPEYRG